MAVDQQISLAWHWRMLMLRNDTQTLVGAAESINVDANFTAPLCTWDSKLPQLIGLIGGTRDINRRVLRDLYFALYPEGAVSAYTRFMSIQDQAYSTKFARMNGLDIPLAAPQDVM